MDIINDNNEIDISEELWEEMNREMDRDEIKQIISYAMERVDLPYRTIEKEAADEDFQKLKSTDCRDIIVSGEKWFSRYDYKYRFDDVIVRSVTTGNKSSDYFHQKNRWKCDSVNSPSPYRTWTNEKFRLTLLNSLWSLKVKKVDMSTLRTCIGLRKYIASQFRPSAAKAIIDHFSADRVLDFSAGWGDRLSGFLASDASLYTGIDPNTNLFEGYRQQVENYGDGKKVELINSCAEDTICNSKYDLVFTSPPYFNIERYTHEDNQSFKRHKKLDVWLSDFLFVSITNAWESLESGGIMVINISDVYSNHTVHNICDPMNDFINSFSDSSYYGCYGYQMRKRPNSGALKNKTGSFAEPMWIWKKN